MEPDVNCKTCCHTELKDIVEQRKIPFVCSVCGGLKFNYKPLHDRVFLWVEPLPEKIGSIYLPDEYYIGGNTRWKLVGLPQATVLAAAEKYWHNKKRKFISRHSELKPGDLVTFNKLLLIKSPVFLCNDIGDEYRVVVVGYEDIYGRVAAE